MTIRSRLLVQASMRLDMMKLPLPSDTMGIIDRMLAEKIVIQDELFQLPPLRFTVQEARTTVTLFAYRKYADLDRQERIYACYQHACLKYVTNAKMTNLTLRERLGIDKQNYPMASRIIKDTLVAGKIKEEKTENQSRNNKGYVPFWA